MDLRKHSQVKQDSVKHSEANFANKLGRMNYAIHTGAILGLSGKIPAFYASLVRASLPVTGFMIWWGRSKKKKPVRKNIKKLKPAFAGR